MPRVHIQKAGKDYPAHGIVKGATYYWWKFRYGGKRISKSPPRPSQLTQSKLSAAYAAREALEDELGDASAPEDMQAALESCAESIREVADEYREAYEAMGEGLQQGPAGELCESNADALEQYADALDEAASEIESLSAVDYFDEDARRAAIEHEHPDWMEDQINTEIESQRDNAGSFDDLEEGEQIDMLDDARDKGSEPELEV